MQDGMMTISSHHDDAAIKAYQAQPQGAGKGSVVVIHEIFGLTPHIRDMAERFAAQGYHALVPDLFTREGPPPEAGGMDALRAFASAIADERFMADLDSVCDYLRNQGHGRIIVVGYCWGGRLAMLYNAHTALLKGTVAYYGRITGQPSPNQPFHPLDVTDRMQSPLLAHFGGQDSLIPLSDVEKLRESLHIHDRKADIHIYPQAGHAFNNDTRDTYTPEAAQLAWQRTLGWMDQVMLTPSSE